MDRSKIHYIRWTIESYDGMATVTTVDPKEAVIELKVSPGCESYIDDIIRSMISLEGVNIKPVY